MTEPIRLRVNALGMSELSTDIDMSRLAPSQMRARLEGMQKPLVRYGLTGRWGEVTSCGTRYVQIDVIGAESQRVEYGDIDLVCERTDLTVKRALDEGSMGGLAGRIVDQAQLELLDELLQAKPPQAESDDFYRGVGWSADQKVARQRALRRPRWARDLNGIVVVDTDVVQHATSE